MRWIESRLRLIEQRIEGLYRRLLNDEGLIAANRQGLRAAFQQPSGTGSGSGDAVFVCYPTAAVSGATWTSGVPTSAVSFSATVYQVAGTGTVTNGGTQTCLNWLPASLKANLACLCVKDGAGNFVVTGQSCT